MFFPIYTAFAQAEDTVRTSKNHSDIEENYLIYKAAALETARLYFEKYSREGFNFSSNLAVDFGRCAHKNYMDQVGFDGTSLAYVSLSTAWVRVRLENLGYPKDTYEPLMKSYEKDFFRYLSGDAEHFSTIFTSVRQIEEKRKITNSTLRELMFVFSCAPPRAEFAHLRSNPSDGKVHYISSFLFELCKAKNLDPWDIVQCDGWSESDRERALPFYGIYVYQVSWPNGITGRGKKRILGTHPDRAKVYTVTAGNSF